MAKSKQNMKVNKGIIKGDNSKEGNTQYTKERLRKLNFINGESWEKLNEALEGNLLKLQTLIGSIEERTDFDDAENEAWKLDEWFKKHNQTKISSISFHSNLGSHTINNEILLWMIFKSIHGKVPTKKREAHRTKETLKELLSIGGYEVIIYLKHRGLRDQYIIDFITNVWQVPIMNEVGKQEKKYRPKVQITSIEAFRTALSAFRKSTQE